MYRGTIRLIFLGTLATCLAAFPLYAGAAVPKHAQSWSFAGHGKLQVHFRAGDLKIVQGADSRHVTLRYSAERYGQDVADRVKLRFDAEGPDALVRVTAPNNVDLDAVLEVPGPLALEVRMLAGDLTVERVEGNKSLLTHFGDIKVIESKAAFPELYRSIEASTRIGDIGGLEFNHEHGWLGHTGEFAGHGPYDLEAHVGTGDINFESQ
jgi:hypothetical protein